MKNLFNLRIFWTCRIDEGADGYFYYYWENFINNKHDTIFAGYNKKALNNKNKSWKIVKERING